MSQTEPQLCNHLIWCSLHCCQKNLFLALCYGLSLSRFVQDQLLAQCKETLQEGQKYEVVIYWLTHTPKTARVWWAIRLHMSMLTTLMRCLKSLCWPYGRERVSSPESSCCWITVLHELQSKPATLTCDDHMIPGEVPTRPSIPIRKFCFISFFWILYLPVLGILTSKIWATADHVSAILFLSVTFTSLPVYRQVFLSSSSPG